jgi:plasmid stabilization system protein ParE
MITLSFSAAAFADIERFVDFLLGREDPKGAAATQEIIFNAVEVLRRHPYIGRKVEGGFRELIISRGRTGYLALYEFLPARSEILIHRLRHQLEGGYSDW